MVVLQEAEGLCQALVEALVHLVCRRATEEVVGHRHRRLNAGHRHRLKAGCHVRHVAQAQSRCLAMKC